MRRYLPGSVPPLSPSRPCQGGDFSAAALAPFDQLWQDQPGPRFREAGILNDLATLAPNIISRAIFYSDLAH